MRNLVWLFLFVASVAFGQFSSNEAQYLAIRNLATNGGAEQGVTGWSVSAGTLTRATAQYRSGSASVGWDASASTQTLSTSLKAIPAGNGACLAEFYYYGFGTADVRIYVKDNSANVIGGYTASDTSWAITTAATAWTRVQVPFSCPASGTTVQLVLEAQGNAAVGYVDDFYLGRDFRVGSDMSGDVVMGATRITSAQTIATSAGTVVVYNSATFDKYSELNTSTGVFTVKIPGRVFVTAGVALANHLAERNLLSIEKNGTTVCSKGAYINEAGVGPSPSCFFDVVVGDTIQVTADSSSDTSYDVSTGGGTYFYVTRYPTASQTIMRGDTSDVSGWLKYAGTASCQWSTSSASMAAFAADTDCATPTVSGNVTAPGTKIPGFVVTNLPPGKYKVEARSSFAAQQSTSGNAGCSYEIYDGTNSGSGAVLGDLVSAGRDYGNVVSGNFEYTSKQSSVTFQVRGKLITGNGTCDIVANATNADFEIVLIPLSQALPRPFIPSSVFAGRQSVVKVGAAKLNCDSGSAILTNPDSMVASIGNISTGTCTVTLTTGYFSAAPICTVTLAEASAARLKMVNVLVNSATSIEIDSREGSTSGSATTVQDAADHDTSILCIGNN